MRITNSMLISDMLWNSNKNLNSMSKYQDQLSTGKAISKPSDDPVGITKILKSKTDINAAEQYSKNIDASLSWLEISESAITDVKEILQRVRELTVQAANSTNTAEDTQKIETEIIQLKDELISLGNSTSAGKYIFSALETDTKLFNEDGTYNINMTSQRIADKNVVGYEVYVAEVMDVGTYPTDIFGIGDDTSIYSGIVDYSQVETTAATQSKMIFNVDLTNDYEAVGEAIDIQVDGVTYTVDMTQLSQTIVDPLTKQDVTNALKAASDGAAGKLSDVASIYYDQDGNLVIESNSYGAASSVSYSGGSAGVTISSYTAGIDGVDATFTSTGNLTDAVVAAADNVSQLVLTFNGVQETVEVDMSTITTVADFITALQTEIDSAFPPAGTITVGGSDGAPLTVDIAANADGSTNTLNIDYVTTNESKLMNDLEALIDALEAGDHDVLTNLLGDFDEDIDRVLTALGDIGGRSNRTEFISSRIEDNILTFTSQLSDVQDVDMAEAIMWFKNLENVYKASLSVGSQVIQPSLVDFLS